MKKMWLPLVAMGLLAGCSSAVPQLEESEQQPSSEAVETMENSKMDLSSYEVQESALFIENGPGLAYFETTPYLNLGESVTVNVSEARYDGTIPPALSAEVSLTQTELFYDHNESGRLGIRLIFKETNTSDDVIEVGDEFVAKNSATSLAVFHGETQLKTHLNEVPNIPDHETYLTTQHVQFNSTDGMETCGSYATLEPGQSRLCYEIVSYAGQGDYLINLATDANLNTYQTYLVNIQ